MTTLSPLSVVDSITLKLWGPLSSTMGHNLTTALHIFCTVDAKDTKLMLVNIPCCGGLSADL